MSSSRKKAFWNDDVPEIPAKSILKHKLRFDSTKLEKAYLQAERFISSQDGEWFTRSVFLESIRCRRQYSRLAIKHLMAKGRLERKGSGRPRDPFLYRMSDENRARTAPSPASKMRKKVFFL